MGKKIIIIIIKNNNIGERGRKWVFNNNMI